MTAKTSAAACQIAKRAFRLKGRDTFLYSGEVHYFRIPRRYWAKHLQALADAQCQAVSSYVPWSWHEPKEGHFDLTGKTHPERDLAGFLDLARDMDLCVTLKPGPYIMAETTDGGIPRWVTRDYPETSCMDENGHHWGPDFVTFASPVLREKASAWFARFAKDIVVPRQSARHGAVIMLQLCNEIGMFQWLGARGDYSPANTAAWHHYLKLAFGKVDGLARLLERDISDFSEVMPPLGPCKTRSEFNLYRIWHDFHRWLYADYVKWIADTLRGSGVAVPFFTNVGGWVYGRAHEFPLNGTFHRRTAEVAPDVMYGIDHIPEFVSTLNSHDGIVATQVADELQRGRKPLYSAELQCGSREHGVEPYPGEMALFYRHCLIHGLTGMNFYMFSQGRNPKGRGVDGPMFYWYNAVDYKGARQEVYPVVQQLGEWLSHNGKLLVRTEKPAGLAVGFYPPLYETEFLFPKLQKQSHMNPADFGLMDPVSFRDRAYFDGVIRILVKKNVPYDLADLTTRSAENLLKYRTLVVLSSEMMDAATQAKLVEYVHSGGRLVIFPVLPQYDLSLAPCRILQEKLGIHEAGPAESGRVYMGRLKDIPVAGKRLRLQAKGATVLAKTAANEVVGIEKRMGKGVARCFGFQVHYSIEEHPSLWSAMMELDDAARNAWTDNDCLQVEVRYAGSEAILFVGNFHRAPRWSHVTVRHPQETDPIDLGLVRLAGLTGLLLPICLRLGPALTLLYAHGELIGKQAGGKRVRLELRGPTASEGRIALRSGKAVREVLVDGQPAALKRHGDVVSATYVQSGDIQTVEIVT
ncbi:MAG: beta-galactosidase [Kiritimatiellae bacterium]|nr:beta-galactosidase [Kiritimatiellia bacterium]